MEQYTEQLNYRILSKQKNDDVSKYTIFCTSDKELISSLRVLGINRMTIVDSNMTAEVDHYYLLRQLLHGIKLHIRIWCIKDDEVGKLGYFVLKPPQ